MSDTKGRSAVPTRRRWPDRHLWEIQPIRDLGVIAVAVGLIWLGQALSVVTIPILLALLLAYLLEPVIHRLVVRAKFSRTGAAIAVIVTSIVLVVVPLAIALAFAIVEGIDLVGRIPDYAQRLSQTVGPKLGVDDAAMTQAIDTLRTWVENNLGAIAQGAATRGVGVAQYITGMIGAAVHIGLLLFLVPFFFFFFSTGYPKVLSFGQQLIPKSKHECWVGLIGRMDEIVAAFIRGQLVIAAILGVVNAVGWLLVGVPSAILLGIVSGVLSLVPYVIGLTLPVAIGLLWFDQQGASDPLSMWWIVGGPLGVYIFAQLLEGYVLQPLVHGKSTNLDAATIVAAVIAAASIAGIYGALLAIPVTACLKIVITDMVWPRVHEWLEGRAEDPLPIGRR